MVQIRPCWHNLCCARNTGATAPAGKEGRSGPASRSRVRWGKACMGAVATGRDLAILGKARGERRRENQAAGDIVSKRIPVSCLPLKIVEKDMGQTKPRGSLEQRVAQAQAKIEATRPEKLVCNHCSADVTQINPVSTRGLRAPGSHLGRPGADTATPRSPLPATRLQWKPSSSR